MSRTLSLPPLSETPIQHPDCCASLSSRLLNTIIDHWPHDNASIISIGCGSGLLEALLLQREPSLNLVGVEVSSCPIKYLSKAETYAVSGTWDSCPLAKEADVWLFAYPRSTGLVAEYLRLSGEARVKKITWIGPTLDWADFAPVFADSDFNCIVKISEAGLADYETLAILTRDTSTFAACGNEKKSSHGLEIDDI